MTRNPDDEGGQPVDRNREAAPADDQQDNDTEQPLGRDERVSGWPASFEDVVRALHAMPRAPREKKPPKDASE